MWWVMPPVVADMERNTSTDDRLPKLVVAVAAAVGAVYAPNVWLRGVLAAVAAAVSANVVMASAGMKSAESGKAQPHWRTLKTYRVEA
jgi:hypothetical protein